MNTYTPTVTPCLHSDRDRYGHEALPEMHACTAGEPAWPWLTTN